MNNPSKKPETIQPFIKHRGCCLSLYQILDVPEKPTRKRQWETNSGCGIRVSVIIPYLTLPELCPLQSKHLLKFKLEDVGGISAFRV